MRSALLFVLACAYGFALGLLLVACGSAKAKAPAVMMTLVSSCHINGVLPDPACTPGATNPNVTQDNIQQTICVRRLDGYGAPASGVYQPAEDPADQGIRLEWINRSL